MSKNSFRSRRQPARSATVPQLHHFVTVETCEDLAKLQLTLDLSDLVDCEAKDDTIEVCVQLQIHVQDCEQPDTNTHEPPSRITEPVG